MATEADLIQKFKDLDIPVGADFEELIHEAFIGANLADKVEGYDSRIATVENDLSTTKDSIQANTDAIGKNTGNITTNKTNIASNTTDIANLKANKVNTEDLPNKKASTLADTALPADFTTISRKGVQLVDDNQLASAVSTGVSEGLTGVMYEKEFEYHDTAEEAQTAAGNDNYFHYSQD